MPSRGAPHAHCLYALKSVLTLRSLQAQGFLIPFSRLHLPSWWWSWVGSPRLVRTLLFPGAPAASPSNLVADFLRPRSVLCTVRVVTAPI